MSINSCTRQGGPRDSNSWLCHEISSGSSHPSRTKIYPTVQLSWPRTTVFSWWLRSLSLPRSLVFLLPFRHWRLSFLNALKHASFASYVFRFVIVHSSFYATTPATFRRPDAFSTSFLWCRDIFVLDMTLERKSCNFQVNLVCNI